jgi:DNA-binding ferritin-like protein
MPKTRKNQSRVNEKNKRNVSLEQEIVIQFMEMLNTVKIFHWKTTSYPTHKATDDLHSELSGSVDTFVETMLGKHGGRVNLSSVKTLELKDFTTIESFKTEINGYKQFMKSLTGKFDAINDSDLLNIRDEILGHLNKFTYLLTFH